MAFCEFEINCYIKENKLYCSSEVYDGLSEGLQYAFYLLLEGSKVDTKYYTGSKETCFQLTMDGNYQIMAFVKKADDKVIKKSEILEFVFDEQYPIPSGEYEKKPVEVSIFGSCVSRDAFEYDRKKSFVLKSYVARQSIVSAVSEPIEITQESIVIASEFKRKSIYNDFMKNSFNLFEKDGSRFLVIDLIDERFKLAQINESLVTYSSDLIESGYLCKPSLLEKKKQLFNGKRYQVGSIALESYIEKFVTKLLKTYKMDQIIIHRCTMVNEYISLEGKIMKFDKNLLLNNRSINEVLNYMYDYLELYLPRAKVIDINEGYFADENHKWGLSPMHYQKEYYIEVFNKVEKYIREVNN